MSHTGTQPAALVIGAGIAGIQAALDIADAGYKVYLVEREPTVGGHMAQLDKTFPTLDCSACILTPKMVDVGRHPNVELMTCSEVLEVEGHAGEFRARVRKRPRYVDLDKCTACADCVKVCPVSRPNEFDLEMAQRKAIYIPFPQAVPNKYVIDKRGWAPCTDACPAHIHAQGYVALIAQGKFQEALDLVRDTVPFPAVLGRVCFHPCETVCNRGEFDEPVSIWALKRFVADVEPRPLQPAQEEQAHAMPSERDGQRVAIVGSGPAGLTAAYQLARLGYGATVFEALPVAGGMLAVGIPHYRLPPDVLAREIAAIEALGVDVRLNTPVGGEGGPSLGELRRDYDAVFLSVGAHLDRQLRIPGEGAAGVVSGVDFLRDRNLGRPMSVGRRVVVVGGGNAAIDAARSALRLQASGGAGSAGASVTLVYRRSRAEMPASAWEVEDAEEEGVEIHFLATPTRVLEESGRVVGLECIRMELGEPDASGRRRPVPVEGSEFTLEADTAIVAIGQYPDADWLAAEGVELTRWGTLGADRETLATSLPGVFAGGDAVSGPASAIDAMAAGNRAAAAIRRYLQGEELRLAEPERHVVPLEEVDLRGVKRAARIAHAKQPVAQRVGSFAEVEHVLAAEDAVTEASRCLNCAVCSECMQCVTACQPRAVDHQMQTEVVDVAVGAIVVATGFDQFDPRRKPEYAYAEHHPQVLTGLEFERLVSSSGPTSGVVRLNGRQPKEVVFIKCIGSRDEAIGNPWCSRVCCMYTAKQAHLIRDKVPDAHITVFYIDVRAFGKGFEEFYDRVREEGVTYRRGNVSEIYRRHPTDKRLVVRADDTLLGRAVEVEADLVVLATGLAPRADAATMAAMLGLTRSPDGFFQEKQLELFPSDSVREGIFLAGCCQGPKDVPDTVAHAKGAAASAIVTLSKMRRQSDTPVSSSRELEPVGSIELEAHP